MDIAQTNFALTLLFILGCAAQTLPLLRPGGRMTACAAVGIVLVLSCAVRDRDWTLLTGQLLVAILLWFRREKP
ncbi:MAG: hypothetical protein K2O70_07090 [Desulfovibrionaceae bacterium]|nr:hypothetical protein [Desulfovibrionaceae bacterium]